MAQRFNSFSFKAAVLTFKGAVIAVKLKLETCFELHIQPKPKASKAEKANRFNTIH
jgi:hypothetical protein